MLPNCAAVSALQMGTVQTTFWIFAVLLTFVVQAVSYDFRVRRGNLLGSGTFSVLIPFVLAYIVWAWRVLDREPVKESETNED